jgi:CO/xanthine dehydrogenase FAD-binding subunit
MLWPFEYIVPTTMQELSAALSDDEDYRIIAGGTDLLVQMRCGIVRPKRVIDIKGLEELQEFSITPQKQSFIGAGVTLNRLIEDKSCPWKALLDAASGIATYQVRNRATIIGNLCHASPAADTAPPMLVLDGIMKIVDIDGSELSLKLKDFFCGPQKNVLKKGQWIRGIEIPDHPKDVKTVFLKKKRYRGHDCSGVNLAGYYDPDRKRLRFAIGSCSPTPKHFKLDHLLQELKPGPDMVKGIIASVLKEIKPISDNRATGAYRLEIAQLFIKLASAQIFA